ncbi:MAG: VWA domain-containing protein, partial [Pseudomonadota bacterium]
MARYADLEIPAEGKLAENITHFARALRKAGLPAGSGRVVDAIRAVEAAGFTERVDFYATLEACFTSRPEHRVVFGQIFRLYWRDPQFLEHMMGLLTPMVRGVNEAPQPKAAERRAAEALLDEAEAPPQPERESEGEEIEFDARLTFSTEERLRAMDFE